MKWVKILLCFLIPITVLGSTRIEIEDAGVVVTGQPVFDHRVNHGYSEYRFHVNNHSDMERLVDVRLNTSIHNTSMNKTVVVGAKSRVSFSLFANRRKSTQRMHVIVDNRYERSQMFSEINSGYPSRDDFTSLLVSKSINLTDVTERIEKLKHWENSGEFDENYMTRRTDLAPYEWSDYWLAYSSFDGIIIEHNDYAAMTPNIRSALLQYVQAGGILTITGCEEIPFSNASVIEVDTHNHNRKVFGFGFGLCITYPTLTPLSSVWLKKEVDEWPRTDSTFNLHSTLQNTNKKYPVVDHISVPVRGFLLLITIFALIAGPVTVFTLRKINRRIWLLWIIPLESLLACSIVLAYSFYSEGITPTVRIRGITILDQSTHSATTLGWLGYYCPQRPSSGLFFPQTLELNKVEGYKWRYDPSKVDWTRGQHLMTGWLEARVPSFYMTRENSLRRERLEFAQLDDGSIEVVNGLGTAIKELWYCDEVGNYYRTEQLKAGQKVSLETTETRYDAGAPLRLLFTHEYGDLEIWNTGKLPSFLKHETYIAILEGSPFMDHGLGDRKVHLKTESLLYGVLKKEVQP